MEPRAYCISPPGLFPQLCRGCWSHCRGRARGTHLGHEDLFLQLGRGDGSKAPGASPGPGRPGAVQWCPAPGVPGSAPAGTNTFTPAGQGLAQCGTALSRARTCPRPDSFTLHLALLPWTEQVGHPGTPAKRVPAATDAHGQHSLPGSQGLLTASHGLSHSGPQLRAPSSEGLGGNKTHWPQSVSF